jgi:hypothetical protein
MPERFNFACYLFEPLYPTAAAAISAVAAALPDHVGSPIEVMVLDFQSHKCVTNPWPSGEALLQVHPGPTETFFAYYTSRRLASGRVCISFHGGVTANSITVSLEDMTIAEDIPAIVEACFRLRNIGSTLANDCVVGAGGELELDSELVSSDQALAELLNPLSLAQWIAFRPGLTNDYIDFKAVRQSGGATVLQRVQRTA